MIKIFPLCLSGLFLFVGCAFTSSPPSSRYQNEPLSSMGAPALYTKPVVGEYRLSYLPDWANIAETPRCRRKSPIYFFDYKLLMQSYNFDYRKSFHLQYIYNDQWQQHLKKHNASPELMMEEQLFVSAKERTRGNLLTFNVPKFPVIHLVWIDPFLSQSTQDRDGKKGGDKNSISSLNTLNRLLEDERFHEGFPIFFSLCLTLGELNQWIEEMKFKEPPTLGLTAEALSIFDTKGNMTGFFHIELDPLFTNKEQKLVLYLPRGSSRPQELQGGKLELREF